MQHKKFLVLDGPIAYLRNALGNSIIPLGEESVGDFWRREYALPPEKAREIFLTEINRRASAYVEYNEQKRNGKIIISARPVFVKYWHQIKDAVALNTRGGATFVGDLDTGSSWDKKAEILLNAQRFGPVQRTSYPLQAFVNLDPHTLSGHVIVNTDRINQGLGNQPIPLKDAIMFYFSDEPSGENAGRIVRSIKVFNNNRKRKTHINEDLRLRGNFRIDSSLTTDQRELDSYDLTDDQICIYEDEDHGSVVGRRLGLNRDETMIRVRGIEISPGDLSESPSFYASALLTYYGEKYRKEPRREVEINPYRLITEVPTADLFNELQSCGLLPADLKQE